MVFTSKEQIVNQLRNDITTKRSVLEHAILRIYQSQTRSEQNAKATTHYNGVGFTGADAPFMSSLAERLQGGRHLSEKQAYVAIRRMGKYARQIVNGSIAEKKIVAYNGCYLTGEDVVRYADLSKYN